MAKQEELNQTEIAKKRLLEINEDIQLQFEDVRDNLDKQQRKDYESAYESAGTYGAGDYARDCYVDAMYEEAESGILVDVMHEFYATTSYLEKFIKQNQEKDYIPGSCMDCGKKLEEKDEKEKITCSKCGRIICEDCASRCDKCKELVCKFCVLFKFRGETRCVECYQDITRDLTDWIKDDWINFDNEEDL